jgi:imidazolonepropionase
MDKGETMATLVIRDPAQIVSPRPGVLRGPALADLTLREGDSILVRDGIIAAIAPFAELEQQVVRDNAVIIDAVGRAVVPGFVDCHSHLIFAGSRSDDFSRRCAGASYEDIAAGGGGIGLTVTATRNASKAELKNLARGHLERALRQGTTTMEVKTGYGLDCTTEIKILEAIAELDSEHPVDLVPTFLGAHAVPSGMTKKEYLREVRAMLPEVSRRAGFCDVFCEEGYFSPSESFALLETARSYGMLPRLHANQFHSIGCIDTAVELEAVSVDHLEMLTDAEISRLAATDITCVMLPGVSLFLGIPYAPGRAMIDAGCIPALASDFNPGSNPCLSLQLVMSLACLHLGMRVPEALACVTGNAAHALRLERVGCLEVGWQADLLVLDCADYRDMVYFYGDNHVQSVIKKGVVL